MTNTTGAVGRACARASTTKEHPLLAVRARAYRLAAVALAAAALPAAALPAAALPGAARTALGTDATGRGRPVVAAPAATGASDDPVDYAVAVDESASLGAGELDREKDAVAAIAVSDPSPRSRMVVFGFADARTATQSPVDEVCPMRQLDTVGREQIAECAGQLRERTRQGGSGTDFISAVRQGVTRLKEAPDSGRPRVLFLLTDGYLDVKDSYRYRGLDDRTRDEQANEDLARALREAADAKVQIRPLGFGRAVDRKRLDEMAAGGYRDGCRDLPQTRPQAEVVDAENLGRALETAFAAARCLYRDPGSRTTPPGDLTVRVSPLATEGTIVVSKGDPLVTATYYDPEGHRITDTGDGAGDGESSFEFTGRGKSVESLRVTRPLAGDWRVHLDAPAGHRDRTASISVLWQGAVRSDIRLEKPSPSAGERTRVEVEVLTRAGVKLDERDLRGITVTGQLTGKGFTRKVPIALADDGRGQDAHGLDGVFSGTVTVPRDATGDLLFSSTVQSVGLRPDTRSYPTGIAPPNAKFGAVLDIPAATVHPGGKVTGTLKVSNRDTAAHTVRLAVAYAAGTGLSVDPAEVPVEPGAARTLDVTVRVADTDALGAPVDDDGTALGGKVTAADGTRVLDDAPLSITVTAVPSLPRRIWDAWWQLIVPGAFVLVAVVAALLTRRRVKRLRIAPGGLLLELLGADGTPVCSRKAKTGRGNWYEFDLVDAATDSPRIERRNRGAYAVRRDLAGGVVLRAGGQGERTLRLGEQLALTGTLSLRIADGRGRRPVPGRRGGPSAGGRSWTPGRVTAKAGASSATDHTGSYAASAPEPEHPDI
ncbi:VWA domain-containing protein [Streptomyces adustus]|uniref:VWA domain-containing protein n=1 Tax=Streptomyces adustus TaxID=1609272 RepID=UPI003723867E